MRFLLILSCCYALSGCAPLVISGIGGTAIYRATKRKNLSTSISDTSLAFTVRKKIADGGVAYDNVSVSVDRGYVMLAGSVEREELKKLVEEEVWKINGVVGVKNAIVIGNATTFAQSTGDAAITTKIKSMLLMRKGVRSSNFSIKTINGIVHVSGIAESIQEKDAVLSVIKTTSGVRKVVSYITVG